MDDYLGHEHLNPWLASLVPFGIPNKAPHTRSIWRDIFLVLLTVLRYTMSTLGWGRSAIISMAYLVFDSVLTYPMIWFNWHWTLTFYSYSRVRVFFLATLSWVGQTNPCLGACLQIGENSPQYQGSVSLIFLYLHYIPLMKIVTFYEN